MFIPTKEYPDKHFSSAVEDLAQVSWIYLDIKLKLLIIAMCLSFKLGYLCRLSQGYPMPNLNCLERKHKTSVAATTSHAWQGIQRKRKRNSFGIFRCFCFVFFATVHINSTKLLFQLINLGLTAAEQLNTTRTSVRQLRAFKAPSLVPPCNMRRIRNIINKPKEHTHTESTTSYTLLKSPQGLPAWLASKWHQQTVPT